MSNKELTPEEIAENVINKTDIIKAITHERKLRQEAEKTIELLSQIDILGTKMRHFGDMSVIEAVQKRPDVAVDMINGVFARAGNKDYLFALNKLKLTMDVVEAARQYINDGYPHKASYPYNNFSDMELAIEVLDKWVGNE